MVNFEVGHVGKCQKMLYLTQQYSQKCISYFHGRSGLPRLEHPGQHEIDLWKICIHPFTAVKRHCSDWYEIWALTDHDLYYLKFELDPRQTSNDPFTETEGGFGVDPTPRDSWCTAVSPTLSWKWPRVFLSPSFCSFFEKKPLFWGVNGFWKFLEKVQIMPLCIISS